MSTFHRDCESSLSSMEWVSKITLQQLTNSSFFDILIHGISDHLGKVITMVTHMDIKSISFDAISITFTDTPFVNALLDS
jgi:hypothetical protein